jgi:predicted lactoylglutathione lyase
MGGAIEVEPTEALLECVHRAAGQAAWLRLKVESLGHEEVVCVGAHGAPALHTWVRMEQEALDRLARLSKMALDGGVAERAVVIAERTGDKIAAALDAAIAPLALPRAERTELVERFVARLARPPRTASRSRCSSCVNQGVRLMLVPTGGFGWVTGNRPTAGRGASDCLLVLTVADDRRVDELVERARQAEAEVVLEPTQQPWGCSAAFADPDGHLWQVTPVAADPLFAN